MRLRWIVTSLSLSLFYLVIHPAWYGDAVWYANSLADNSWQNFDFGHLIWRPAGYVLWKFLSLFCECDPLVALQLLSALFSGAIPILGYFVAKQLQFIEQDCIKVALALLFSHFLLAYGASGSSYTPALFFNSVALIAAFSGATISTAIFCSLAFSFWALSALFFPAIVVTACFSKRRLRPLFALSSLIILFSVLLLGATYILSSPSDEILNLVKDSGHGIPIRPTVTGIIRAILGTAISFLHLGNVGTFIKGIISREWDLVPLREVLWYAIKTLLFFILTGIAAFNLLRDNDRKTQAILIAAFLPVFTFATIWQGSDIERMSPALVVFVATFIYALKNNLLKNILITLIIAGNILTLILPTLITKPLQLRFAESAKDALPKGSLIITTGQSINAVVGSVTEYFAGVRVYNISIDVINNGVNNWQNRVETFAKEACNNSATVAVISDFYGLPTYGGLQLSNKESPTPSLNELKQYFSSWQKINDFKIDRFQFFRVSPSICID